MIAFFKEHCNDWNERYVPNELPPIGVYFSKLIDSRSSHPVRVFSKRRNKSPLKTGTLVQEPPTTPCLKTGNLVEEHRTTRPDGNNEPDEFAVIGVGSVALLDGRYKCTPMPLRHDADAFRHE